jgi:hypothetical protein
MGPYTSRGTGWGDFRDGLGSRENLDQAPYATRGPGLRSSFDSFSAYPPPY